MKTKRVIMLVSLVLAFALLFSFCQDYVFRTAKRDMLRVEGFRLEEKNSLDVVIIGSSEVYYDYAAPYAYELQGFTSYPYAVASCPVSLWKTMVEDILSRQTPQTIVVEINGALYGESEMLHNNTPLHYVLDGMPLNKTKLEALDTLLDENTDDKAAFILPLIKYHSNWQNLNEISFVLENMSALKKQGHSILRGVVSKSLISPPKQEMKKVKNVHTEEPLLDEAEQYLREFLEYCKEKDLNVIFTAFPHQIAVKQARLYRNFKKTNTVERIVDEYGFPFLNLERLTKEMGIDPYTDYNEKSHLNIYGQKKLTEYLARYLVENCGVSPVDHGEKQKAEWAESVEYYALFCRYVELRMVDKEHMTTSSNYQLTESVAMIGALNRLRNQPEEEAAWSDSELEPDAEEEIDPE